VASSKEEDGGGGLRGRLGRGRRRTDGLRKTMVAARSEAGVDGARTT
jgi:hypothetical protein